MTKEYVKKQIQSIAQNELGAELKDGDLKENGIDSIGLVTLIFNIEAAFGFMFCENDLQPENLVTTEDLIEITMRHI